MKNIQKLMVFSLLLSMSFLQADRQALVNAALKGDKKGYNEDFMANLDYINSQDKHGDTPLMTIIKIKDNADYDNDTIINAVSMLLAQKADYEIANKDGNNPLLKVVSFECYRNNEILERLLYNKWFGLVSTKNNINIEVTDKHGNTPLIRAAGIGNSYAVRKKKTNCK